MTKQYYKVILTGKSLPGVQAGEMKENLSKAFKIPLDEIERRFTVKPILIKSGIDLSTAKKYEATFERAGAESKIIPLSPDTGKSPTTPEKEPGTEADEASVESAPPKPTPDMPAREEPQQPPQKSLQDSPPEIEQPDAQEPERRILSPDSKPVSLQYTPLPCRALTATNEGLNFNRFNCDNILFSDIILLSVFNTQEGAKFRTELLVFIKRQKKPLLSDARTIQYDDFPGVRDDDEYISLRNFVNLLINKNSHIIIDESTNTFLQGGKPEFIKKDVDFHSSALGAALDSENLFELSVMKGTLARAQSGQPSASTPDGSDAQSKDAKPEVPVYSEDEYMAFFIGPNSEKYLRKFKGFAKREGFSASWHWPAFLVPFFWLLYRKYYLLALGVFFLSFIPLVNFGVFIAMGISAYYLYYNKAKKTLDEYKTHTDRYDITAHLIREGGVNTTSVFIGIAAIFLATFFIGGSIVFQSIIKEQQDAVTEMISTRDTRQPMPTLPDVDMPPGFPEMPQRPEEFMQAAYDTQAKAILNNACSMAQVFFSEYPDEMVTLETLEDRYGFNAPPDIDIQIIDPTIESLSISAQHNQSSQVFYVDEKCHFQ
jgi:hypothetical protein